MHWMAQPLFPWRWLALPLSLALLAGCGVAHADEEDHERARKALQAGEVLPLKTILERVERAYPGQVMDVELERSLGLVLVADEEMGNERGIKFLLKEGVFKPGDIMFVPDHGTPRDDEVEIAEKHILWLKFTVTGKQVHASRPDLGTNAMRVGSELIVFLQDFLHRKYNARNELFTPDRCTFEPTKRLQTVGNVNTIPGEDVFYFDCRILPQYDIDALRSDITAVLDIFEQKTGTQIRMETVQEKIGRAHV